MAFKGKYSVHVMTDIGDNMLEQVSHFPFLSVMQAMAMIVIWITSCLGFSSYVAPIIVH